MKRNLSERNDLNGKRHGDCVKKRKILSNEILLYSTGKYIQSLVMGRDGG